MKYIFRTVVVIFSYIISPILAAGTFTITLLWYFSWSKASKSIQTDGYFYTPSWADYFYRTATDYILSRKTYYKK